MPLTVWMCSDQDNSRNSNGNSDKQAAATADAANAQREVGKVRGAGRGELCPQHRGAVGYQLARHLISSCTSEGDVVAEAFTTSEATLVAAAQSSRPGVALVPHFPLARHIGTRLRAALTKEQLDCAAMRSCRPDQMHRGLADVAGRVGLVVAAPPPYEIGGRVPKGAGSQSCPACRADLWMLTAQQLTAFLVGAWKILRPGGTLAIITTARHEAGRLVDPAPRLIQQASAMGFRYVQHIIALRIPVEGGALVVQAAANELAELRDIRSRTLPPPARVHADVLLLAKPRTRERQDGEA
ncbi:hypothetical protein ACGFNU_05815 [Spirillospora sp. NPDC048911]|uniref:hypothetical protein n=1 Tax=Spirillospora sp. NPDC048911 TaxID=3364527 RepID=UPI00372232E2